MGTVLLIQKLACNKSVTKEQSLCYNRVVAKCNHLARVVTFCDHLFRFVLFIVDFLCHILRLNS